MPRNIVICCDGTANEFAKDNTNVVKLYYTLVQDPARQVTYYHPGVGTMEPAGALTTFSRKVTKLLGMAIGYGLENDIRDAYLFLMDNFKADDRVFLFGFSRGAYTARAVTAVLHRCGLLRPGNGPLVPYAIRMMMGLSRADRSKAEESQAFQQFDALTQDFRTTMARHDCKPYFVGVWDTVNSVGWLESPLKLPDVTNNPDIKWGRHAVALNERRAFFRNHLWGDDKTFSTKDDGTQQPRIKQVWFPGVHCDIGGGYEEENSGLSKIALKWMLEEANDKGLLVDDQRVREVLGEGGSTKYTARPDANAYMHESLKGPWHIAELIPKKHYNRQTGQTGRKMNLWGRRNPPAFSLVHPSAWERKNFEKWIPPQAVNLDDFDRDGQKAIEEVQKKNAKA